MQNLIATGKLLPARKYQINIYPTYEEQIEDLVQYVLYVVDMNEHDQIQQTTETLTALSKESELEEKQLLQLLIDYITRKDISQRIKKLKEPYKSINQSASPKVCNLFSTSPPIILVKLLNLTSTVILLNPHNHYKIVPTYSIT